MSPKDWSDHSPVWLLLQEVDVGCDRSRGDDCGSEIAAALGAHAPSLLRPLQKL